MAKIYVANPGDKRWYRNRYLFHFGAYGTAHVLAYGDNLQDALDAAAEFMVEQAWFGLITPHDSREAREAWLEARDAAGPDAGDEDVLELYERDQTYTESGYIPSWEWFVSEPSNEELRELAKA